MFKNYLKIAIRLLFRFRTFSFINIFGLSIGLTACLLIFSYVKNELSYEDFQQDSDRIFRFSQSIIQGDNDLKYAYMFSPMASVLKEKVPEVEEVVRFTPLHNCKVLVNENVFSESNAFYADPSIFDVFTIDLIAGSKDDALTLPYTVAISESIAQKYFGKENPVGKQISLNNELDLSISSVFKDLPKNTRLKFELLISNATQNKINGVLDDWESQYSSIIYTKLYNAEHKELVLEKASEIIRSNVPIGVFSTKTFYLTPFKDLYFHDDFMGSPGERGNLNLVVILASIAILILFIASVNFMNLATAQYTHRTKEVGIRKVLGARLRQLVPQFIGESILLVLFSMFIGLILFRVLLPKLEVFLEKELEFNLLNNPLYLFSTIGLIILIGVFSGSYPAFFLSQFKPVHVFKGAQNSVKGKNGLRKLLVIFQFVIAVFLIFFTIVVFNQIRYSQNMDMGYDKENIVYIGCAKDKAYEKLDVIKEEIARIPEVEMITSANMFPGFGAPSQIPITKESGKEHDYVYAWRIICDYEYTVLFNFELIDGRTFEKGNPDDKHAVILNQTAVKTLGLTNPIGEEISVGRPQKLKIIGIIKDFHIQSMRTEIKPIYIDQWKYNHSNIAVKIRPENEEATLVKLQRAFNKIMPDSEADIVKLTYLFERSVRRDKKLGYLLITFSILIVIISCLGLYGLVSFNIEKRQKEIGIRKVMGSSAFQISSLFSRQFVFWALIAICLAWPLGYLGSEKWLENFVYRIDISVWEFVLSGSIGLIVAIFTVSIRSRKAANLNPVETLRFE